MSGYGPSSPRLWESPRRRRAGNQRRIKRRGSVNARRASDPLAGEAFALPRPAKRPSSARVFVTGESITISSKLVAQSPRLCVQRKCPSGYGRPFIFKWNRRRISSFPRGRSPSRESRETGSISFWIPAFAGMTAIRNLLNTVPKTALEIFVFCSPPPPPTGRGNFNSLPPRGVGRIDHR